MSNYIGTAPVPKELKKFFYKLTRNSNQELIYTKVAIDSDSAANIVVNDPDLRVGTEQHAFQGFDTDYVVINTDANHEIVDEALGVSQYKVRNDDINYYVDENGNLIARINQTYSYS